MSREKLVKVFVALSLDSQGNPCHLKMRVTPNVKQDSVRKFAQSAFAGNSVIRSDGYRSYIPALQDFHPLGEAQKGADRSMDEVDWLGPPF